MKVKIFIWLIVLSCPGMTGMAQNMLSFTTADAVYLRWEGVRNATLEGYNVYRRPEGGTQWQLITPSPVPFLRNEAAIREQLGCKAELYFQLFGVTDETDPATQDMTPALLTEFFANEKAVAFMEIQSLINPEFGVVLGEIYRDDQVRPEQQVQYRITALVDGMEQEVAISPTITTGVEQIVSAVANFSGMPANEQAQLQWDKQTELLKSGRIVTYRVYRSTDLLGEYEQVNFYGILPVTVSSGQHVSGEEKATFTDKFLTNGQSYFYVVRNVNAFNIESSPSPTVEIVPVDMRQPLPPFGLRAEIFGTSVRLQWEPGKRAALGYEIFKAGPELPFERIYPVVNGQDFTQTHFIDTDVEEGGIYYYYLRTIGAGGASVPSDTLFVLFPDNTPPAPPIEVEATASEGVITITWTPNSERDISGYEIERIIRPETKSFLLSNKTIATNSYNDTLPNTSQSTYGYVVFALDQSYNRSAASDTVFARLPEKVPPQTPTITSIQRIPAGIEIDWTPSPDEDLANYRIYRSQDQENYLLSGESSDLQFIDTTKSEGMWYFTVASVDESGNESEKSRSVAITIQNQNHPQSAVSGTALLYDDVVVLSWAYSPGYHPEGIVIYRTDKNGKTVLLKQLDGAPTEYRDAYVFPDQTYTYLIKTRNDNWQMSEGLEIKFVPE